MMNSTASLNTKHFDEIVDKNTDKNKERGNQTISERVYFDVAVFSKNNK